MATIEELLIKQQWAKCEGELNAFVAISYNKDSEEWERLLRVVDDFMADICNNHLDM